MATLRPVYSVKYACGFGLSPPSYLVGKKEALAAFPDIFIPQVPDTLLPSAFALLFICDITTT